MITIKKIATLKPRVQLRKLGGIFHEALPRNLESEYLSDAFDYLMALDSLSALDKAEIEKLYRSNGFDDIYYYILNVLGESPADWDLLDSSGDVDWSKRRVEEHYLYLDHLRSPYNVGSIFRSAESFGVKEIYLSQGCASPEHSRARRTSRDTVDGIPWCERSLESINMPIFALELGGEDISTFKFPEKGICIIGSEESGVSEQMLALARASAGIVSIKQYGAKGSINVSSATTILLYEWMNSKR